MRPENCQKKGRGDDRYKHGLSCAKDRKERRRFRPAERSGSHIPCGFCCGKNSDLPVTAKIRIGWDEKSINAVETAHAVEAAEQLQAVHGRTREQYYSGKADWSQIAAVKRAVDIPVIGNGDVTDGSSAVRMMKETGYDFVMIARGALGNPWIFREALAAWKGEPIPPPPSAEEKKKTMMLRHLKILPN